MKFFLGKSDDFLSGLDDLTTCFGFARPLPDELMFVCSRPAMPKQQKQRNGFAVWD